MNGLTSKILIGGSMNSQKRNKKIRTSMPNSMLALVVDSPYISESWLYVFSRYFRSDTLSLSLSLAS